MFCKECGNTAIFIKTTQTTSLVNWSGRALSGNPRDNALKRKHPTVKTVSYRCFECDTLIKEDKNMPAYRR